MSLLMSLPTPIPRDLHLLSPTLTLAELDTGLRRAVDDRCRAVVVPPVYARHCVDALRGSGVGVTGVVGFPLGLNKPTVKAIEATSLAKDNVDAIEVTPLAAPFREAGALDARLERVRAELLEIVRGVRAARQGTAVHVRLDLDRLPFDADGWAAVARTLLRSACDGVVFVGNDASLNGALDAFIASVATLSRKIHVLDHAQLTRFDPVRIDAFGIDVL